LTDDESDTLAYVSLRVEFKKEHTLWIEIATIHVLGKLIKPVIHFNEFLLHHYIKYDIM